MILIIKHKNIKHHRNYMLDIFFNVHTRTEIMLMCQRSTFKEFNSKNELDRIYLNNSYLMLLLNINQVIYY